MNHRNWRQGDKETRRQGDKDITWEGTGIRYFVLFLSPCLLVSLSPCLIYAAEPAGIGIELGKEQVKFLAGKDLIGQYHIGPTVARPYLWPVRGPGGVPLTRAWPMERAKPGETKDHPHQKSAWFCHGDVIPEGIELKDKVKGVEGVDFWSEAPGHGQIVCIEVGKPKRRQEPRPGRHPQRMAHRRRHQGPRRRRGRSTCYDLGDARLFVFDIDLHASVAPITFGDTKEGSFGIRVNDAIRDGKDGKGKLENAEGKVGEKECWGQHVGLVRLFRPDRRQGRSASPSSTIRTTRAKACWHSRGYGLMAANPFGRAKSGFPAMKGKTDLVKLAKGEHLKLRYGMLLHPGDAKSGKVAEHYEKFVKLK